MNRAEAISVGRGDCEAQQRLVFLGLFVYISSMLILLLKALYISFLIVLFYLELAFTVTVAFLKVTFFGL